MLGSKISEVSFQFWLRGPDLPYLKVRPQWGIAERIRQ